MKLLLTSAGFTNKTIATALQNLAGKPIKSLKLVYIPTAANVEEGDKWWVIEDLNKCLKQGFKELDIVDFTALDKKIWLKRLQKTDVILFGGGNTSHLMRSIFKHSVDKKLKELLKKKVYMGVSAGSHIVSKNLYTKETAELFNEDYNIVKGDEGLGYVDFLVIPHLNSKYFDKLKEENIAQLKKNVDSPIYAIDDQSAVIVDEGKIKVVSEGEWKKFE